MKPILKVSSGSKTLTPNVKALKDCSRRQVVINVTNRETGSLTKLIHSKLCSWCLSLSWVDDETFGGKVFPDQGEKVPVKDD